MPTAVDAKTPVPAVVLLHDQGGWASDVMTYWHSYVSRLGIVVIAPEALSNTLWNSQADGPAYLHEVVAEVNKLHSIDTRRVYLFGERGGGTYAMTVGLFDSTYWAATAVHGRS